MAQALGSTKEVVVAAARTASSNSGVKEVPGVASKVSLSVDVTAVSGTVPTLDITVEWSTDGGTTFFVPDPVDTFDQITAAAKKVKLFDVKAPNYLIRWTIAGTTPSFTFAVDEFVR